MARRTKEDAEKTRESLLDAAEVVFLRRGVSRASLDEIAKEAGVTRGAIYWHFENKLAIFQSMNDRVKMPMDMLFDKLTSGMDPLIGLKQICLEVFKTVESDIHARNVFTIARLRHEDTHCIDSDFGQIHRAKRDEVIKKFTRVFAQIEQDHPLAPGVTPESAALLLHVTFSGLFWDYLTRPEDFPISTIAPLFIDGFFRGILR